MGKKNKNIKVISNPVYKYYVAYGSNLNVEQMRYRCPDATPIGTAIINGYELLYKGSKSGAYLTIEKSPDGKVPVVIWRVSAKDEKSLDRYEGFPNFYYKRDLELKVKLFKPSKSFYGKQHSGITQVLDCFVYIMHENRQLGVPNRYYVDGCAVGYRTFGFDRATLTAAFDRTISRMNTPVNSGYTERIPDNIYDRWMCSV